MSMDVRRFAVPARHAPEAEKKTRPMTESLRMLVFLEIVQAQDEGLTVIRSRARVAGKYKLTTEQVTEVEREGLAKTWAPL